jgi:hypothetical protein
MNPVGIIDKSPCSDATQCCVVHTTLEAHNRSERQRRWRVSALFFINACLVGREARAQACMCLFATVNHDHAQRYRRT